MEREREETGKRAQDMLKSNKSLTQERLKVVNTAAPLPSRKKKKDHIDVQQGVDR